MSSFYKLGVDSQARWFPSSMEHHRNQAGEIIAGISMMNRGGRRMYEIGALEKQVPVAPTIHGMVQWASDALMGFLLFGGFLITVGALKHREDSK